MIPRAGEVLLVDGQASVQFDGARRLVFRVISVSTRPTYHGWAWIQGYVLDESGAAIDRREIFVRHEGLRRYRPPLGGPSVGSKR